MAAPIIVMAGPDRPSPACRDAAPSLSRRKRGRPGRWTSQLLLLRPRPSAWPVTSSNKLRPAAFGVTAPSSSPRALPFPPIRSGISAPHLRHGRPDRPSVALLPSWPTFRCHGRLRPAISAAGPSFLLFFDGPAVIFVRQAIIFGHFCWLNGHFLPPSHHFCPFLTAQRSFSSAKPSFLSIIVGTAVIFSR